MSLPDQLQRTLGDGYTLERELVGGGMARVFVARDRALDRLVVIKTLSSEDAPAISAERFRREIRLAASLQQANIVPVHSTGEVDGAPYYTMPFVEGESLRARLTKDGALPVRDAINVLRDVARALAFAHERGVVHRDIKPENILLSGSTAVVTDFGIAKAIEASQSQAGAPTLTHLGTVLGTPAYMSPEQAAGEATIDHRADIYSLGIVAYELLAGGPPFTDRSAQSLMAAHISATPLPLAQRRPDVPPRLSALVMRCLEKDPTRRPESATELLRALDSALASDLAAKAARAAEKPSIAVLPFANLSPDPADEFFADGLTDEIITDLAGIHTLHVIARSAMMRYKGAGKEPRDVARELKSRYVLEGSVRRAGPSLRLSARLVDTADDSTLWSDKLNGVVEDIFDMQERVSRTIVQALKVTLSPREERRLAERPIEDLRAYEAYLQARQAMWSFGPESLARARQLIELAGSRAGENQHLTSTLGFIAIHAISAGGADIRAEAAVAEQCARRVAELAPDSFNRYALAGLLHWRKGEIREAIAALTSAHEREPSNADVVVYLEYAYLLAGRDDRARELSAVVVALDPVTPLFQVMPAFCDLMTGRARDVLANYVEFAAREPLNPLAQFWLLGIRAEAGDIAGMRESANELWQRWPETEFGAVGKLAVELLDDPSAGSRVVIPAPVRALSAESESIARTLCWLLGRLGAHDAALDALEDAVRRGLAHYPHLARDSQSLAGLRNLPRFAHVLSVVRDRWERGGTSADDLISGVPTPIPGRAPTIAVLPLANLSSSADDEYFADGMTEDIIAQLSQIASLRVISRTSVMGYRRSTRRPGQIAAELGASHVMEGSVRRAGTRVRIVATLMEAKNEAQLWSETFDRDLTDIFAIQSELAQRIASAFVARLTPAEIRRVAKRPTADMEAYNLFLLGRQEYNRVSPEAFAKAEEFYAQAIARDPGFARAYAAKALVDMYHGGGYWGVRPTEAYDRAVALARKALELDPEVGEAHLVLGAYESWIRFDWAASEMHFKRAMALNPSHAFTHIMYCWHLAAVGRLDAALDSARVAVELDPAAVLIHGNALSIHYLARRHDHFDSALATARQIVAFDGVDIIVQTFEFIARGKADEILPAVRALAKGPPNIFLRALHAWCAAAGGAEAEARDILRELHALEQTTYVWATGFALAYAHLGEPDKAIEYLERAYRDRAGWMNAVGCSPAFDIFRGDPRFDAIVKRVGVVVPPEVKALSFKPMPVRRSVSAASSGSSIDRRSVAVLPFANLSPDAENEYFTDGVTEDLIRAVGKCPGLRVTARTSSFAFKGATGDIQEIGAKLNVGSILEGSVRRAGTRIRVSAQLINVADGKQIWSERFDRELNDIFAIQDEISSTIAGQLETRLASAGPPGSERRTPSAEAYDAYLRGRFEWNTGTPDGYRKSLRYFERAISLDSNYSLAYVGIAEALAYAALIGEMSMGEVVPRARAAAEKALELSPRLPEAQSILAFILFWFEWEWVKAEAHFERALALDPNAVVAHNYYSVLLSNLGRASDAVAHSQRAVELDPFWANAHQTLQWALFQAGRYDEVLAEGRRALELTPDYPLANVVNGFAFLERAAHDEALREFERALSVIPRFPLALAGRVQALARMGKRSEAVAYARLLEDETQRGDFQLCALAWAHCALGETEKAFDCIERAVKERDMLFACLPSFTWWDPLRLDPRFDDLLTRLRYPEWSTAVAMERRQFVQARTSAERPTSAQRPSVAILPFTNLSPDPENEYFADGITDDLIAQVAKIGSLRVIARTSVVRYRTTQTPAVQAARELGVSAVVEGTVRRAGKRARIVAQLVDASSEAPIWSETFDRDLDDIFSVQTEVATNVAQALKASLSSGDLRRLAKPATRDATAYDLYLIGRHHYNRRTPDSLKAAIGHFELAIAHDPEFAAAHAGLADAYVFAGIGYAPISPTEAFAKAKDAADRALSLDETSPEALCSKGLALMHGNWDTVRARESFRRAAVANPNHAAAHQFLAWCLFAEGDYVGGLAQERRALELDPLNVSVVTECGWPYSYAGLHEIALQHYQRAVALDPGFGLAHYNVGIAYHGMGLLSEAIGAYKRAIDRMGRTPWVLTYLASAHVDLGDRNAAEAVLNELRALASDGIAVWLSIAMVLDSLGRVDEAFSALDRSIAEHEPFVWAMAIEGWLKLPNARHESRFVALLDRVGARAHDVAKQRELLLAHEPSGQPVP